MGLECLPHLRIKLLGHELRGRPNEYADLILTKSRNVFWLGYVVLLDYFFDFVAELPVAVFSSCQCIHDFELETVVLGLIFCCFCKDLLCKLDAVINFTLVVVLVE